jgi:hypothetical protein
MLVNRSGKRRPLLLVARKTVEIIELLFRRHLHSTIGKSAIALLLLLTTVSVFAPKYSELDEGSTSDSVEDALSKAAAALDPDWKYIGRAVLIVLDVVFLVATLGLLFSRYLLRKIVR